jgi:hypothetical protein
MGKVKTMHKAQIRGKKNKETAWGKKMKEEHIMYCHNSGRSRSKSDKSTLAPNQQ